MKNHTHAFVKEFSASSLTHNDAFIQSVLRNAKGPLVLYTAGAGKDRESDALPGVYFYAQGNVWVVNWRTFYDLPKMKPMRIRVGGQVAPQLIHHMEAARQWRYKPTILNGDPVEVDTTIMIAFGGG
jgi:hypothetical protein